MEAVFTLSTSNGGLCKLLGLDDGQVARVSPNLPARRFRAVSAWPDSEVLFFRCHAYNSCQLSLAEFRHEVRFCLYVVWLKSRHTDTTPFPMLRLLLRLARALGSLSHSAARFVTLGKAALLLLTEL